MTTFRHIIIVGAIVVFAAPRRPISLLPKTALEFVSKHLGKRVAHLAQHMKQKVS